MESPIIIVRAVVPPATVFSTCCPWGQAGEGVDPAVTADDRLEDAIRAAKAADCQRIAHGTEG